MGLKEESDFKVVALIRLTQTAMVSCNEDKLPKHTQTNKATF